jgi:hypothetical protein
MHRFLKRWRPSPAMLVALLALFVAMGGSVYAANKISGKTIKKASLPGNRIKKNSLTGKQVKESTLGTVPKATNAGKLGGLDPSGYKTASNYTQDTTDNPITGTVETIGSPIQITTEGTRRVIATGAVHAVNGVSGTGVYLVCHITIDGTSGVDNTDYASPAGGFTVVDAAVSPLASAVVGAGAHTVTLLCDAAGGAPQATVVDDALAAWAVSG